MFVRGFALAMFAASFAMPGQAQERKPLQSAPAIAQTAQTAEPLPWQTIVSLRVLAPSSNDFKTMHGELVTSPVGSSDTQTYRWGGASCPGRNLEDTLVLLLSKGLTHKMNIQVETKNGAGGSLCIVGFTLGY